MKKYYTPARPFKTLVPIVPPELLIINLYYNNGLFGKTIQKIVDLDLKGILY